MASKITNFRPRVLTSVAIFIFLSGSTSSQESTRCYWCGPLAEQVHRSQRSPPCDSSLQHQIVCDEGYPHCATIATSPPYVESRLCVKFYQDECYSRYCNSTKTWRMVCPCRGNLCNGNHTERETEAFAAIAKRATVASARNKRNTLAGFISVKTRSPLDNSTIIIIQNETAHDILDVQGDQPGEEQTKLTHTNGQKLLEDNIIIEHGTKKDEKPSHVTNPSHITNPEVKLKPTSTTMKHDATKVKATIPNEMMHTEPMAKEHTEMLTTNEIESKKSTVIEVPIQKTSDKPPVEALQETNPTKPVIIEVTTVPTLETSLITTMQATTPVNETKKNDATRNLSYLFVFIAFFLHFCH